MDFFKRIIPNRFAHQGVAFAAQPVASKIGEPDSHCVIQRIDAGLVGVIERIRGVAGVSLACIASVAHVMLSPLHIASEGIQ